MATAPAPRASRRVDRHSPRQDRSRATRDRILAALGRLLAKKAFDEISTAELTRAARCSMSSLYARFPTKDALLAAFHDRFFEFSIQQVGTALQTIDAQGGPAEERIRRLLSFFVSSYREHRGLLCSLVEQDRRPAPAGLGNRTRAYKHLVFERALAVVFKGDRRAVNPDVMRAFGFSLWLVVLGLERVVLFDGLVGTERVSDEWLAEALSKVLIGSIAPPEGA